MIIRIEDLKNISQIILAAVDNNELSVLTETLGLEVKNNTLFMYVTNREYFVKAQFNIGEEEDFYASVNANLFLKLVSQISTDVVEFYIESNNLIVKCNGTYKLPLIYDGDSLLKLPPIELNNITTDFYIEDEILLSVFNYNKPQLSIGTISRPVQKMYYIDEQGAITFTSGACVNNFVLEKPVKILLNDRLVKLFKLFKGRKVHFYLGHDALSEDLIQTKVKFECEDVTVTSILQDDSTMLNSVPVNAIRNRANKVYDYSVSINKNALLATINRMSIFESNKNLSSGYRFTFNGDLLSISDFNKQNVETIFYDSPLSIEQPDDALVDLWDLKFTLDTCNEEHINLSFGDGQALIIKRKNITNVIPELTEV